jgi:hypothetical protein
MVAIAAPDRIAQSHLTAGEDSRRSIDQPMRTMMQKRLADENKSCTFIFIAAPVAHQPRSCQKE